EVERAGLTAQQLRIDVELQLRKFGIPVLTRDASYRAPGSPYLHVHVTGSGAPSGIYGIAIQLKQRISLERDASVFVWAPTWTIVGAGAVGSVNLHTIRNAIRDYLDQFVNAYLSANPRSKASAAP